MSIPAPDTNSRAHRLWRSSVALFAGFLAILVLSLGTDQVLHVHAIYPPWGEPIHEPGLNLLALSYRCAYGVLGICLAAALAPRNPMRHALTLGGIGFALSLAGAIATIPLYLGPAWHPIAIVVTALPCASRGGILDRRCHSLTGAMRSCVARA